MVDEWFALSPHSKKNLGLTPRMDWFGFSVWRFLQNPACSGRLETLPLAVCVCVSLILNQLFAPWLLKNPSCAASAAPVFSACLSRVVLPLPCEASLPGLSHSQTCGCPHLSQTNHSAGRCWKSKTVLKHSPDALTRRFLRQETT